MRRRTPSAAAAACVLEQARRRGRVDGEESRGAVRERHVRLSEMDDGVDRGQSSGASWIAQVDDERRRPHVRRSERLGRGRAATHVVSRRRERGDQVRGDEAGRAGNEHSHAACRIQSTVSRSPSSSAIVASQPSSAFAFSLLPTRRSISTRTSGW